MPAICTRAGTDTLFCPCLPGPINPASCRLFSGCFRHGNFDASAIEMFEAAIPCRLIPTCHIDFESFRQSVAMSNGLPVCIVLEFNDVDGLCSGEGKQIQKLISRLLKTPIPQAAVNQTRPFV